MSALRAATRSIFSASRRSVKGRAFMSTQAPDSLFQAPSLPISDNPSLWLNKYPRADPSHLWKVGSFPLQSQVEPESSLSCSVDLWDTSGMLSALDDHVPLRDADGFEELLRQMDGYFADSVLKKRRKKMNKHKHRKRKKAMRMRTKKN
ncbi:hypothetical protein PsorP6_000468 [Peronosclerospora sorghi]|uniref:Uncharacterized protein n=1 Tax=Peronosclerospora sorghi TaxID=230839 RepID=A0ACC0WV96_9STRA|nr:hypothetical protein PsorP6_000468 [Peronosclerospora sorghi]